MVGVEQKTPHHKYDVAEHTLHALKNVKKRQNIKADDAVSRYGKAVYEDNR